VKYYLERGFSGVQEIVRFAKDHNRSKKEKKDEVGSARSGE
jgi:hypothetical protein